MNDNNKSQKINELMQNLSNSNPIEVAAMPSSSTEKAQTQLKEILMANNEKINIGSDPASFQKYSENKGTYKQGKSKIFMVAAAACLAFILATVFVVAPFGTDSAVAAVQNAAEKARKAGSGRVDISIGELAADEASLSVLFESGDLAITNVREGEESLEEQALFIDGVAYAYSEGEWIGLNVPDALDGVVEQVIGKYVNPQSVFEIIEGISEAEDLGEKTIDGKTYSHFKTEADFSDLNLDALGLGDLASGSPLDSREQIPEEDGTLDLDVYIDEDGVLSIVDLTAESEGEQVMATIAFSELGSDQPIEAPANVEVIDLESMLGADSAELEALLNGVLAEEGIELDEASFEGLNT